MPRNYLPLPAAPTTEAPDASWIGELVQVSGRDGDTIRGELQYVKDTFLGLFVKVYNPACTLVSCFYWRDIATCYRLGPPTQFSRRELARWMIEGYKGGVRPRPGRTFTAWCDRKQIA